MQIHICQSKCVRGKGGDTFEYSWLWARSTFGIRSFMLKGKYMVEVDFLLARVESRCAVCAVDTSVYKTVYQTYYEESEECTGDYTNRCGIPPKAGTVQGTGTCKVPWPGIAR